VIGRVESATAAKSTAPRWRRSAVSADIRVWKRLGPAVVFAAGLLGDGRALPPPTVATTVPVGTLVRFERESARPLPLIADADWMAAWPAWLSSCEVLASARDRRRQQAWQAVCAAALRLAPQRAAQVRDFFAEHMDRYRVVALDPSVDADGASIAASKTTAQAPAGKHTTGLMTGYYEPVLEGSRKRDERFVAPVYRTPPVIPTATRSELEVSRQLQGQELIWVSDPIDAYFLEVQGSGRVHLPDGAWVRLAYAASNGQAYRSIGRWLADQGQLEAGKVTMQTIRDWAHAHPRRVRELLDQNPRVVFFRELPLGDANAGPVGTLGVALTPGVSVAVDPRFVPLGAPLLLSTIAAADNKSQNRIAIAQDTGNAIRGPLRVDWFWGQGPAAGEIAGRQRAHGSVRLLVPRGVTPETLL